MKITLILVVTVLCGAWGENTVPATTVTTQRPWTQRFRDGLMKILNLLRPTRKVKLRNVTICDKEGEWPNHEDKFFAGVAVATSVQNALHNGKGKHKLTHHDPVHNKNSHTLPLF